MDRLSLNKNRFKRKLETKLHTFIWNTTDNSGIYWILQAQLRFKLEDAFCDQLNKLIWEEVECS